MATKMTTMTISTTTMELEANITNKANDPIVEVTTLKKTPRHSLTSP